jgi:hypothetical protein
MTEMANQKRIEEQIESLEERLGNAEEYVARGVNREGRSWLHMDDWRGRSGHPLWMRNKMIPSVLRAIARKNKALEHIERKEKDKSLSRRRKTR